MEKQSTAATALHFVLPQNVLTKKAFKIEKRLCSHCLVLEVLRMVYGGNEPEMSKTVYGHAKPALSSQCLKQNHLFCYLYFGDSPTTSHIR